MTVVDDGSGGIDIVDVDDVEIDPRFEERRAEVARHRSTALRRRLVVVAGLAVAVLASVAAVYSPLLDIDTIDLHGADGLSPDDVLAEAGVAVGDPMVTTSPADVEARLERSANVARATVTRRWPSTLDIRVTPRAAVVEFRWPDGSAAYAGRDGVIVTAIPTEPADVAVVAVAEVFDTPTDELPGVLAEFASTIALMPSALSAQVSSMIVAETGELLINLVSGAQVQFGDSENAASKFASLVTTLGGQVDLDGVCGIDVRLVSPVTMLRGSTCGQ